MWDACFRMFRRQGVPDHKVWDTPLLLNVGARQSSPHTVPDMKLNVCIAALLLTSVAACGGDKNDGELPDNPPTSSASSQPTESVGPTAEIEMRGNAATNNACQLLTLDQVTTLSELNVYAMLGLETQGVAPAATSESCTWFLDSKEIQASLVVQYTLHPKPPADLLGYYPTVVQQGFGKEVPELGDYSKISSAVLDTIDRRAEIHVTLRRHYPDATPEDQAATIALMRLVMAGIPQ